MPENYSKERYSKFSKQTKKAGKSMKQDISSLVERMGKPREMVKKASKAIISEAKSPDNAAGRGASPKTKARLAKLKEMAGK